MRHPTQAALRPPAQAEALYDIALERESNTDNPEEIVYPAERKPSVAGVRAHSLTVIGQPSEAARLGPVHRTALSENLALPPNVRQTNH